MIARVFKVKANCEWPIVQGGNGWLVWLVLTGRPSQVVRIYSEKDDIYIQHGIQ